MKTTLKVLESTWIYFLVSFYDPTNSHTYFGQKIFTIRWIATVVLLGGFDFTSAFVQRPLINTFIHTFCPNEQFDGGFFDWVSENFIFLEQKLDLFFVCSWVIMAVLLQKKDLEDKTLNLWGDPTKQWNTKPQKQKRF